MLSVVMNYFLFFFSSRRRHTSSDRDWSSDVCSSDLDALTTEFDEKLHSDAVAEHTPATALDSDSARESLYQALDRLGPEFREVIVLRELEGLSYKEIGDVTGVPIGTVMSRLARARRRLQVTLRNREEGE